MQSSKTVCILHIFRMMMTVHVLLMHNSGELLTSTFHFMSHKMAKNETIVCIRKPNQTNAKASKLEIINESNETAGICNTLVY